MNIRIIRELLNMTQHTFSNSFGIPLGTLRNWEQGLSNPPDYVYTMLTKIIRRDEMINIETLKLVELLNELVERTLEGIEPFEKAVYPSNKIYYDPKTFDGRGYKVVCSSLVTPVDEPAYHHDIISYYDRLNNYTIRVILCDDEEESQPYVEVSFDCREEIIIIDNGKWYFD
ncbi:MAG: hypothetical protein IKC47_01415 [Clostridia bacterium]|nr:hypothetical protein [Clostridia bacterium]